MPNPALALRQPHYENLPMQYTDFFFRCKHRKFHQKIYSIFLIFAQNIDRGYTLALHRRGVSYEYPQSMFLSQNKKNKYSPANPSLSI